VAGSPQRFNRSILGCPALVSRLVLEGQHEWHQGCVNTISFTPSGTSLISGSDDRHIVLGDWQTGAIKLRWHSGHHNNVFQAKAMPFSDERVLVTCAADGQVRISEIKDGGEVHTRGLVQHRGRAHKLAVDPNSPHMVLSTGEDGYVQQMDIRESNGSVELVRVCKPTARRGGFRVVGLNSIALNPANPHMFCTGGDDPICRVWDRRKLPHRCTFSQACLVKLTT
jgi:WD repeat-containing protein 42A